MKIITGDINSGKSTRFLKYFSDFENRVGLYSKKLYDEGGVIVGYDLVLLPLGKTLPFIMLREQVDEKNLDNYYMQGCFAFSKEAFAAAEEYVRSFPDDTALWIDEIGGLELKGLGYDSLLKVALESGRDIVIVVRQDLLGQVRDKYGIKEHEIL
ncbi:MAG: nucleoside-triphosphatase [Bacteroidales bacterium]